jgi:DNA (cytosine-5)-methyltransferase 1
MTGATMFSGILAPEVALPEIGWRWCAEIEPFCRALIKERHPGLPNLGDVMADDFIERASALGPLDLLVAGSPCQAFSVAGNRNSLNDSRGNLTLRLVEVVDAIKPRYLLWENVPGVLSTHDNAFGCFLGALVGAAEAILPVSGWTDAGVADGPSGAACWRILDAQYFGLAQRRKRVFVVFRAGACGVHPAEILFEWESLRRDYPPGREAGERSAPTIAARATAGGGLGTDFDCDGGLVSMCLNGKGGSGRCDAESETFVAHALDAASAGRATEDGTGRGVPLVPWLPQGYRVQNPEGVAAQVNCNPAGGTRLNPVLAWNLRGREGGANLEETDLASLCSASGGSSRTYCGVRRLTPTECERLQGFPDGWTAITYCGKPAADGPRYKALGNSMAVVVLRWIGLRLYSQLQGENHASNYAHPEHASHRTVVWHRQNVSANPPARAR